MKKKFTTPTTKVLELRTSSGILNEKFGNNTYVPVNNVVGDDGAFDGYEDGMYSNGSFFDEGNDKWDSF